MFEVGLNYKVPIKIDFQQFENMYGFLIPRP
jgi:hypothetical protein